jgi:hypothetical protein
MGWDGPRRLWANGRQPKRVADIKAEPVLAKPEGYAAIAAFFVYQQGRDCRRVSREIMRTPYAKKSNDGIERVFPRTR